VAVQSIDLMYRRGRPEFVKRFLAQHPQLRPYLEWLDDHAIELTRVFHEGSPHTLLHMDYRLDNLFFDQQGVAIFDWQMVSRGPGVYDASYFISGSHAPEFGVEAEHELVIAYHAALVSFGVSDYPLDRCLIDYQRSMMLNLYRLSSASVMDLGEGRGAEMMDTWVARLASRIGAIDLEKLL
jgi:aminoglycoside phosphotransferase (APT) family kinase protein